MATVSIAEAGNRLSDLIDRALSGKQIFITRDGRPVIAVKPVPQGPRPLTAADLDWLAEQRRQGPIPHEDAGTAVRRLRDEG